MTISASDEAADGDRPDRSLELYRDLAVALRGQIAQLKAAAEGRPDGKGAEALKLIGRALAVTDAEGSLVGRSRAEGGGAGGGLDLAAARAEIAARLAVWAAAS